MVPKNVISTTLKVGKGLAMSFQYTETLGV